MTVRELINVLLDKKMDEEVLLRTIDQKRPDVSGVVFHIDKLTPGNHPEIVFTDWRDEMNERTVGGGNENDLISRQDTIDALHKKRIETREKGQER